MENCNACDKKTNMLKQYDDAAKDLFDLWKKETGGEFTSVSQLIDWALTEHEKMKVNSSILGHALKGEQLRTDDTVDELDMLKTALWATTEQVKMLQEEEIYTSSILYLLKCDIKDLLTMLPSTVARCEHCDSFICKCEESVVING